MQICPKDGTLMVPEKTRSGAFLVCKKCGRREKIRAGRSFKIKEKVERAPMEKIPVVEKEIKILPVVKAYCDECGNEQAETWSQQTRSTDEPETRFYKCTKCGHTWREYS